MVVRVGPARTRRRRVVVRQERSSDVMVMDHSRVIAGAGLTHWCQMLYNRIGT